MFLVEGLSEEYETEGGKIVEEGRACSLRDNCISDESSALRASINVAKYFFCEILIGTQLSEYAIRLIGFDGDPTVHVITRDLLK